MEPQMKLEHEVSFRWLLLFALPTIFSSIFANLYTTVDGIFVARWVDTDALSAINITLPMTYLASALGMMFGTGGNALVAKKLGEGKGPEAREDFSLLMAVAFAFSVVLAFLCFLFLDPLCRFLGSDEALLPYWTTWSRCWSPSPSPSSAIGPGWGSPPLARFGVGGSCCVSSRGAGGGGGRPSPSSAGC